MRASYHGSDQVDSICSSKTIMFTKITAKIVFNFNGP